MRIKFKDRIGQKFTMLTIIEIAPPEYGCGTFKVQCECGIEKYIRLSNLTSPTGTKSCGCKKIIDYEKRNSGPDDCVKDGRFISIRKYSCYHKRLFDKYGKANKCEMCEIEDAKRYEYALKKGCEYSDKIDDYIQMCVSCHRKYDLTEETRKKMSKAHSGSKRPWVSERMRGVLLPHLWVPIIQKSKDGMIVKEYPSPTIANLETKISRTAIMNVLAGRAETSGGYYWEYKK